MNDQFELRKYIAKRQKARRLAVQALYQWHMSALDPNEIELQFRVDNDMSSLDGDYFHRLLLEVVQQVEDIDAALKQVCDFGQRALDPVEHAILRISCFELQHCLDTPYKIIISEAIALTRKFGSPEGFKFVNANLDRLAQQMRPQEHTNSASEQGQR